MLLVLLLEESWFEWMWSLQLEPIGYGARFVSPGNWVVAPLPALIAVAGLLAASRLSLNRGGHALVLLAVLYASFMAICFLPTTYWLSCVPGFYWRSGDLAGLLVVCATSLAGILLRACRFTTPADTPRRAWCFVAAAALAVLPSTMLACNALLSNDIR